jgi:hypothetical protein
MSLSECSGIAQRLPGEMGAKISRPFQHFPLDIPAGFGSFRSSSGYRSAAVSPRQNKSWRANRPLASQALSNRISTAPVGAHLTFA